MGISDQCPFCGINSNPEHSRIVLRNDHAVMIRDDFPVSTGHSLIISKRHVGSFFQLTGAEQEAVLLLLKLTKIELDKEYRPDSYNIGINDGPAAGQTINHCHVHLIPRYEKQGSDPRGGVRWVVPEKADYWSGQ